MCVDGLGCAECAPGTGSCEGNKALSCRPDGSGFDQATCDPELGLLCQPGTGSCQGPCTPENLNRSYIGCEYFPTQTHSLNGALYSGFSFAIVVANTSPDEATITVRRGDKVVEMVTAAPGVAEDHQAALGLDELRNVYEDAQTIDDLDNALRSKLVAGGAYHVKATRPVTVYQFNPLEFQILPRCRACARAPTCRW